MAHRTWILLFVLLAPSLGRTLTADDLPKEGPLSLNDLKLEVAALQSLHLLSFNENQMEQLRAVAKETASKPRQREPGKSSSEYRTKLAALHLALMGDDTDLIDTRSEELDELTEAENPTIDDKVEITKAACQKAPGLLKDLRPRQIAGFLARVEDEIIDPLESLEDAIINVRGWEDDEWEDKLDVLASTLSKAVAGIDLERGEKIMKDVGDLLKQARELKPKAYEGEKPIMMKEAQRIVGNPPPFTVLQNYLEYEIAELLSNPRLLPALKGRLPSKNGV